MKLSANDALVVAVTNLGENHGEEIVPATSIKLRFRMVPRLLNQFSRHLPTMIFDEQQVPRVPELGSLHWKPEYEKAAFSIAGQQFTKADVKKISFWATDGFMVEVELSVKVNADEDGRGVLTGLVKQEVIFALEKMTQKRIEDAAEPPVGGEKKDESQPPLPGTEAEKEKAPTTDGKPIVPLVH